MQFDRIHIVEHVESESRHPEEYDPLWPLLENSSEYEAKVKKENRQITTAIGVVCATGGLFIILGLIWLGHLIGVAIDSLR